MPENNHGSYRLQAKETVTNQLGLFERVHTYLLLVQLIQLCFFLPFHRVQLPHNFILLVYLVLQILEYKIKNT